MPVGIDDLNIDGGTLAVGTAALAAALAALWLAPGRVAELFGIPASEPVLERRLVFHVDDRPEQVITSYLPADLVRAGHDVYIQAGAGILTGYEDSAFIDVGVRIAADAAELVWNAHVDIEVTGNPYARFWNVLTEIVFREYFARPRTTSFGPREFDRFVLHVACSSTDMVSPVFLRADKHAITPMAVIAEAGDDVELGGVVFELDPS